MLGYEGEGLLVCSHSTASNDRPFLPADWAVGNWTEGSCCEQADGQNAEA